MARTPRALLPELPDDAAPGADLPLSADARHHLGRVLRLRPGDPVELLDGRGGLARARWTDAKGVTLQEQLERSARPTPPVRLAVAPPRPSRLDWLIEKAVELGVAEILLLQTEHAERTRQPKRLDRLQRKADEALLQCRRLWRTVVQPPADLDVVLDAHAGAVWFGDAPAEVMAPPAAPPARDERPLLLVIGPEGGLSDTELQRLRARGALAVRCGHGVLRVETAALALAVLAGS